MNNHDQAGREPSRFRLPDPPEHDAAHAAAVFNVMVKQALFAELLPLPGNSETTLITAGRYVIPHAGADTSPIPYPHMMVARDVDVARFEASQAYVISEQGKPPDWVIMLASDSTAEANLGPRATTFESLGVPEYWLLDHRVVLHVPALIGNRLVNGRYEPIEIETLADGSLQGYSAALGIVLRWTGEYLDYIGLDSARAEAAEARADSEGKGAFRPKAGTGR